jgi:hypothetical protein
VGRFTKIQGLVQLRGLSLDGSVIDGEAQS